MRALDRASGRRSTFTADARMRIRDSIAFCTLTLTGGGEVFLDGCDSAGGTAGGIDILH